MLFKHIGYRIKGFCKIASLATKYEAIMTTETQVKLDALLFWDKHGLKATMDAYKVSRSTLYRWRKLYLEKGLKGLIDKSKTPHHRRKRDWALVIIKQIRHLRLSYPNIGSEKLHRLLKPFCAQQHIGCPSARTIARIIADAQDKMRCAPVKCGVKRKHKKGKKRNRLGKSFKALFPGHCIAMDTIVYIVDNTRYHLLTAIDLHSRFALAVACRRANSKAAADFLRFVEHVVPFKIKQILTDNGSEYQKAFNAYCEKQNIRRCYTYPRCPKMNAFNERFNRTLQEEFVEYHEDLLGEDLTTLNDVMFEYLNRYNTRRPHHGIGLKTPIQKLAAFLSPESNMLWHLDSTRKCNIYS